MTLNLNLKHIYVTNMQFMRIQEYDSNQQKVPANSANLTLGCIHRSRINGERFVIATLHLSDHINSRHLTVRRAHMYWNPTGMTTGWKGIPCSEPLCFHFPKQFNGHHSCVFVKQHGVKSVGGVHWFSIYLIVRFLAFSVFSEGKYLFATFPDRLCWPYSACKRRHI